MGNIKDQIDGDVHDFFENIATQQPDARKKTLKLLLEKYMHLSNSTVLLGKDDFNAIKDYAANFFKNEHFPKSVGDKKQEIDRYEASNLSIIEGTIAVLNRKECLSRLPKFDYRNEGDKRS